MCFFLADLSGEVDRLRTQVSHLTENLEEKDREISALREQLMRLRGNADKFSGKRMLNLNAVL